MNAEAFRHLFGYHFSENRKLWDQYVTRLSETQFTQAADYSHGSVREQVLHLLRVDEAWFSDLVGTEDPLPDEPAALADREQIQADWEAVEARMRQYLQGRQDEDLFKQPLQGEDRDLYVWQVLLQVVNHGTDHRAQLLRQLNDLGIETSSQDYIFYAYNHPVDGGGWQ